MGQLKNPKVKVKRSDMTKVKDSANEGQNKMKVTQRDIKGVTCEEKSGVQEKWYGVVEVSLLQTALVTREEQVRLDAFALLCENQKTSETIESVEINLIKSFIPDNLNNQNPAFRQQFISLVKKVCCNIINVLLPYCSFILKICTFGL